MTHRWCSGCYWWEFISKRQAPRVVVWLYTRFPSCYGWMILIWVEGAGFLNSDSDQSLSPVNCTLLTQPLCLSLLPLFQSGNFDLFLRGVCVCVCVGGGGGWWWVEEGKEIWYETMLLLDFIFFHIFFISYLDLDYGNPKTKNLSFYFWYCHGNSPWWQMMPSLAV